MNLPLNTRAGFFFSEITHQRGYSGVEGVCGGCFSVVSHITDILFLFMSRTTQNQYL